MANENAVVPEAREIPMLFSGPMVRAILDGSKTQTRRIVTSRTSLVNGESPCMKRDPAIISAWSNLNFGAAWIDRGPSPAGNPGPYLKAPGPDDSAHRIYSRIQPGDHIWVRETWCEPQPKLVAYRADLSGCAVAEEKQLKRAGHRSDVPWRPSIFMPRWASRTTLEVTEVRVQRLQDISDADIAAEGVDSYVGEMRINGMAATGFVSPPYLFAGLWDSINGNGCSWASNPWVWAISFRRLG